MSLYLYLNEHWHAETWINGGEVPINPASFYRRIERGGIFTPDENLIHKSEVDLTTLGPFLKVGPGSIIKDFTFVGCVVDDEPFPDITNADYYENDGLILSFSSRLTGVLARKMKKKACIKIVDMDLLKRHLDDQLGVVSEAGPCKYTSGHQRNHFLKSDLDEWQAEYRLFWPVDKKAEVFVPAGTAQLICTW